MLVFAYFLLFKYDAHMVVLDVMKNPEWSLVFKWHTIENRQPATEDENAGRSTHCIFVLVSNDRHIVLGRTSHRVSYSPGKANRYPQ